MLELKSKIGSMYEYLGFTPPKAKETLSLCDTMSAIRKATDGAITYVKVAIYTNNCESCHKPVKLKLIHIIGL